MSIFENGNALIADVKEAYNHLSSCIFSDHVPVNEISNADKSKHEALASNPPEPDRA